MRGGRIDGKGCCPREVHRGAGTPGDHPMPLRASPLCSRSFRLQRRAAGLQLELEAPLELPWLSPGRRSGAGMMRFEVLDPRPIPAAEKANTAVLGCSECGGTGGATGCGGDSGYEGPCHAGPLAQVLGVEVTIPSLAQRCSLGNIDPQHSGGNAGGAAIEAALMAPLPGEEAVLATVRPDLDSVGAMGVLAIRARGESLEPAMARIQAIAESDTFACGRWPGPRPLIFDGVEDGAGVEDNSMLAPLAAEVGDFKIPLADRVAKIALWLLTGEEPVGRREAWERERREIAVALETGAIEASVAHDGRVAVVKSAHRAAMPIGYRLAPVVVAMNPSFRMGASDPHLKYTVAQYQLGYVDMKSAMAELANREPGWGGSPTIIGSTQGVGSTLSLEVVVEVVSRHLIGYRAEACAPSHPCGGCEYCCYGQA